MPSCIEPKPRLKCAFRRQVSLLTTALLILSWFVSGCSKPVPPAVLDLPIYFTCDTQGRLEPCGCFTGQFGGLSRLKTVLDAEASTNAIRVDVGDAVGGHEDYDLIEYRQVLQGFAAMHYDALNLGGREAQFSITQLRDIKRTTAVPILSANLLDRTNGQPVFDSYHIVQRGAFRIAFIGVLDPRGLADTVGEGVTVGDMESAIDRSLLIERGWFQKS